MKKKISKLAIAGFVIAVIPLILFTILFLSSDKGPEAGLAVFGLMSLVMYIEPLSLIFSIISLFLIKKNNLKGKSFAIAGIVISAILFIIVIIIISRISYVNSNLN